MNEIKKVLFIVNKYAGGDYKKALEGRIISYCERADVECSIEFTKERGHAYELAREAASKKMDRVFAVGGDGTVNETARALIGGNIPMGILPKGSGNGLARHLGIGLSLTRALQLLKSDRIIPMDSFSINDHLSVNVSGIGFDAHIASLFGENGKRGLTNYARLVIREYSKYVESAFEICLAGNAPITVNAMIVAIANSSQFGNNARIAPGASVTDGLLDISCISKIRSVNVPKFAWQMFTARLESSKHVSLLKTDQLTIRTERPMPYHVDGEPMGLNDHFDIRIQPASLKMIIPNQPITKQRFQNTTFGVTTLRS